MHDFKALKVWKKAHEMTVSVYGAGLRFPPEDRSGIVAQLLRAAVSVCANIAEGMGRRTSRDVSHFLVMAKGSANEVQCLLLLSRDLGLLKPEEFSVLEHQNVEVQKMLVALIHRIDGRA